MTFMHAARAHEIHFHADLRNNRGSALIPNTTWDSISSFTWISQWESLKPEDVAKLNITGRYPFLRYAQLYTATGGCAKGFVDKEGKSCKPWLLFDAPRSPSGVYNWTRLLLAIDNVLA